ncbi:ABC transporter ATP-binding protein [Herbaspirillum sp. alder98]|uniref:ABC transporter ATP-binding protein n=1 Tax=Herbaspirillum sp. alder98 TaxID=2913096 RepID=UPI001CD886A7|nr:ABC transporter ATP-binding protein [Herbaspirillum sp. alder98]MCA1323887.1 ABC transporter ATP-binding protein [Herbaspirillum sp. alder98]
MQPEPLLSVAGLHAWYDASHVLHGVDLNVNAGEIVAVLGRNGAGRSTLLKTLVGQVRGTGTARFGGHDLLRLPGFEIARLGVGYVPESRDVFPTLTVEQNLLLGQKPGRQPADGWQFDQLYAIFPALQRRRTVAAGALSGGEQQMLALARAAIGNPTLLLVDEPTEGLSPQMVEQVALFLRQLQQRGVAILLIEQKQAIAMALAQRLYVMGRGQIVFDGTPAQLQSDLAVQRDWLAL